MKILYDTSMLYLDKGGIHYYSSNLFKYILKDKNLEVIPFPLATSTTKLMHFSSFKALFNFINIVKAHKDIIVYIPHPRLYTHTFLTITSMYLKVPTVVTIHDVHFLVRPQSLSYKLILMPRYSIIATLSKLSKNEIFFTTVSKFSKEVMITYLKIPEAKIKVIYPGVDDIFFQSLKLDKECARNFARKILSIQDSYILYVGAMHPSKGVLTLMKAYKEAKRRGFKYNLVLA